MKGPWRVLGVGFSLWSELLLLRKDLFGRRSPWRNIRSRAAKEGTILIPRKLKEKKGDIPSKGMLGLLDIGIWVDSELLGNPDCTCQESLIFCVYLRRFVIDPNFLEVANTNSLSGSVMGRLPPRAWERRPPFSKVSSKNQGQQH